MKEEVKGEVVKDVRYYFEICMVIFHVNLFTLDTSGFPYPLFSIASGTSLKEVGLSITISRQSPGARLCRARNVKSSG